MAITNRCAAGRETPRTNIQSKHAHGNSPGNRVYGQTKFEILISKTKYSQLSNIVFRT